jgi:CDP-diacylglycerol--glycerol-3-phosphate 3-phosphatidyltransferase
LNTIVGQERQPVAGLSEIRKAAGHYLIQPVVRPLARTGVTPNTITWIGFLLSAGGGALIITGHLFIAGLVVLFAGLFDMMDGALARLTGRVTSFGAILDSTLDRLAEAVLLLGILYLFARGGSIAGSVLVGVTLLGSLLVSYIKARAESLGIECSVGIFTRPERVIVLALGLLLSQINHALIVALAIIAAFSFFTAGQRLVHSLKKAKSK